MIRLRGAAAVCVFSLLANLRSRLARLGGLAFVLIAALGQGLALTRGETAPEDDRLFGYAFLVGAVLLLRSGLAEQRRRGLDEFLRHNFLGPAAQAAGHAAALVLQLTLFCAFAFLTAAVLSGGDVRFAAWYTAVMGLATALFLPVVLAVEMASDFRLPLAIVPLLLVVTVAAADAVVGSEQWLSVLGLRFARYDASTLLPLAVRAAASWMAGFGLIGLLHLRRHRPRSRGDASAVSAAGAGDRRKRSGTRTGP